MRVISLEISNILSIESASLSFEDNGLTLIEGWNYDTGRANGAGKSAIFNSLSFALYDKLPRKITASEIVKRGSKQGYVKCSVLCSEEVWTVQRFRPKGVKFFRDGIEQNITQDEFESYIRLSYDQFLLTVYTAQANSGTSPRFLTSPDADKKTFLLRLLNLEQLNECKKTVDDLIKSVNGSIAETNSKLNAIKSKVEAYSDSLIDANLANNEIVSLNQEIESFNKDILLLSNTSKPDLSKYSKIEEDIRSKQAGFAEIKAKRNMLHDQYRKLSGPASVKFDDFCSECGTELDNTAKKQAHASHQEKVNNQLLDIKSQIDECDSLLYKEKDVIDLSRKIKDKKQQESLDYNSAVNRISELNAQIRIKTNKVEMLNNKLSTNNDLLSKIDTLNVSLVKGASVIGEKNIELELLKTLASIYSPTGAQAYVLDSVVDSFNEKVQDYIDIVWPNASYILNSYKENAKGDVVAKFSETLTLDGNVVSVGSLSGGELKALSLCVDFALLDILETQFGLSLNPIVLDEPFDGLDSVGREMVLELLEKLSQNRQIMVIDHTSEVKAAFSKTIRIEKKGGTSSLSSTV